MNPLTVKEVQSMYTFIMKQFELFHFEALYTFLSELSTFMVCNNVPSVTVERGEDDSFHLYFDGGYYDVTIQEFFRDYGKYVWDRAYHENLRDYLPALYPDGYVVISQETICAAYDKLRQSRSGEGDKNRLS